MDASADLRGSFTGLDLRHTLGDVIRASMEGISMNLRLAMDVLGSKTKLTDEMLLVGGGTKSRLWRQIFADIYEKTILETTVGQDAGALGAAALALKGVGIQDSYDFLCAAHVEKSRTVPDPDNIKIYRAEMPIFQKIADSNSELGVMMAKWEKEK